MNNNENINENNTVLNNDNENANANADTNSISLISGRRRTIYCLLSYFVCILLIVIDQITKLMVVSKLEVYNSIEVIPNFFYIYRTHNTGSAFSMFADKAWGIYMLTAISIIMSIVIGFIIYRLSSLKRNFVNIGLVALLGGAIGNMIDRIRLQYVVDFLRFDFGSYTFPVFNFADMCAVVGTFMIIGYFIFRSKDTDLIIDHVIGSKKENK